MNDLVQPYQRIGIAEHLPAEDASSNLSVVVEDLGAELLNKPALHVVHAQHFVAHGVRRDHRCAESLEDRRGRALAGTRAARQPEGCCSFHCLCIHRYCSGWARIARSRARAHRSRISSAVTDSAPSYTHSVAISYPHRVRVAESATTAAPYLMARRIIPSENSVGRPRNRTLRASWPGHWSAAVPTGQPDRSPRITPRSDRARS